MRKCQQLICQCFFSGMYLGTTSKKSAAVRLAYRTLVTRVVILAVNLERSHYRQEALYDILQSPDKIAKLG